MGRRPPTRPGGRPGGRGRDHREQPPAPLQGTLAAWLHEAARRFAEAGLPSPRVDAQRLAAFGLGLRWSDLWAALRSPLGDDEERALRELMERRAAREPLAYIIGTAEFCGLELEVGPGVLVPRPETETLVAVALELLEADGPALVVDVGTGSGAIALALARARPDADVHATESSPVAADYARRNAERHGLAVTLHGGDLLSALPAGHAGRVDLVVSNPPYVPAGREDLVAPDVLAEPREALFAGARGDEVLLRLVGDAPGWLRPGGALALEVGTPAQAEVVLAALDSWEERGVEEDHTARPRVVWGRSPR